MSIASFVKEQISNAADGSIITLADFTEVKNPQAVALTLSRLAKSGAITRLSKGQYCVPQKTRYGVLMPSENEIIANLLEQKGGYLAGASALNRLGVTTQIPSEITIWGSTSTRSLRVGSLRLKFVKGGCEVTSTDDFPMTDILEALRLFPHIPSSSAFETLEVIKRSLKNLKKPKIKRLIDFSAEYRPAVRALLGALLQSLSLPYWKSLKANLNPLTTFDLGISENLLPNRSGWRIR
jgi:hypothetical protein